MGEGNEFPYDDELRVPPLGVAAAQMHEMYLSFMDAGFSPAEALKLVSDIITAGIRNSND